MFSFDTSSTVARVTPLLSTSEDLPFIAASPQRMLTPAQQVLYKRYALELLDEQYSLLKAGLPAHVVLEEDILSLVTLESRTIVEVAQPLDSPPKSVAPAPVEKHSLPTPAAVSLTQYNLTFKKKLGSGGQGSVYLAGLNGREGLYAVKVVPKEESEVDKDNRRALLERDILVANNKAWFLCGLEAAFHDTNAFYFLMPFYSGGDLHDLLRSLPDRRMSSSMARFYMAEMAQGLSVLHGSGFLHRDLKLQNIFLKADGHICIGDFGMAIPFADERKPVSIGHILGTPTYMAPEVVQGLGYTVKSDWWALGVCFYVLVHGDTPWSGFDDFSVLVSNICEEDAECDEDLDPAMRHLLGRMLLKRAAFRYDYQQVAEHGFFSSIPWETVAKGLLSPPHLPLPPANLPTAPCRDVPLAGDIYEAGEDPLPDFPYLSPKLETILSELVQRASSKPPSSKRWTKKAGRWLRRFCGLGPEKYTRVLSNKEPKKLIPSLPLFAIFARYTFRT